MSTYLIHDLYTDEVVADTAHYPTVDAAIEVIYSKLDPTSEDYKIINLDGEVAAQVIGLEVEGVAVGVSRGDGPMDNPQANAIRLALRYLASDVPPGIRSLIASALTP